MKGTQGIKGEGERKTDGTDWQQPGWHQESGTNKVQLREFLLNCRRREVTLNGRGGWRFSLVEVGGEQRRHTFETLEEMVAFLRRESGAGAREQR